MSRFLGAGRVTETLVAAATPETLIQLIADADHRVAILGYGVGGTGTSNTEEPGNIDVMRQTNAGTASALTLVKLDDSIAETLLTTGQHLVTVEPASGDLLRSHTLHPQAALDIRDAYSREIIMGGGDRIGLRVTFADAQNLDAYVDFEE